MKRSLSLAVTVANSSFCKNNRKSTLWYKQYWFQWCFDVVKGVLCHNVLRTWTICNWKYMQLLGLEGSLHLVWPSVVIQVIPCFLLLFQVQFAMFLLSSCWYLILLIIYMVQNYYPHLLPFVEAVFEGEGSDVFWPNDQWWLFSCSAADIWTRITKSRTPILHYSIIILFHHFSFHTNLLLYSCFLGLFSIRIFFLLHKNSSVSSFLPPLTLSFLLVTTFYFLQAFPGDCSSLKSWLTRSACHVKGFFFLILERGHWE